MRSTQLEKVINDQLEDATLEEFFENFDLTPFEVVSLIYENGLLDEDVLIKMLAADS